MTIRLLNVNGKIEQRRVLHFCKLEHSPEKQFCGRYYRIYDQAEG